MKAAGISAHQMLAPLIVASLGIAAPAVRVQRDAWWSNRARAVTAWSDNDYRPDPARKRELLSNVWLLRRRRPDPRSLCRRARSRLSCRAADRSTIARAAPCSRVIDADRGRPVGDAWLLRGRPDLRFSDERHLAGCPQMTGLQGVDAEQLTLAKVDPDELDYLTLRERIGATRGGGPARRPTAPAPGSGTRSPGPLSTLLMPLLAAIAAFGLARSGQVLLRACGRDGAGLRLFRRRQFQPRDGQCRRLPALPCGLGAVPACSC